MSSGSLASTPAWSGHINTLPEHEKKGGCGPAAEPLAVDGEALGRSRGGPSSKVHLAVDGRGLPMRIILTPNQAGDNPQLLPLLDEIRVACPGGGHPRVRPDMVIADNAYSHPSTRTALRARRVGFTCPNATTSSPIAQPSAHAADAHPRSTWSSTHDATWLNAPSTGSHSFTTWPPATPHAPPTTKPNSPSPPPSSGSDDLQDTTLPPWWAAGLIASKTQTCSGWPVPW